MQITGFCLPLELGEVTNSREAEKTLVLETVILFPHDLPSSMLHPSHIVIAVAFSSAFHNLCYSGQSTTQVPIHKTKLDPFMSRSCLLSISIYKCHWHQDT